MMSSEIDRLFAKWDTDHTPGCALGIVDHGESVRTSYYGLRDLESRIPIDGHTAFDIGSESKQFTGASIALLVERGQLSLSTSVHDIIPGLPDYGYRISIDHLVHHTSGIPDYYESMLDAGYMTGRCTMANAVDFICQQPVLDFEPGEKFSYSNSGYVLLARAVERITKTSFAQFVAENIFRPLGMTSSVVFDAPGAHVPNMARGHVWADATGYVERHYGGHAVPGSGCLYSTMQDLFRWVGVFRDPKIGGDGFLQTMLTPGLLNEGSQTNYGFGLDWGQCFEPQQDLHIVTHAGAHAGSSSILLRVPDDDLSVILLCNTRDIDHCNLAVTVARLCLSESAPNKADTANGR